MELAFLTLLFCCLALYITSRDLKWGLVLLVLTLPLNNRLMFDLFISQQLLPVRLVLVAVLIVLLKNTWLAYHPFSVKERWSSLLKMGRQDPFLFLLISLLGVRVLSLINVINFKFSLTFMVFYLAMIGMYLVMKYVYAREGREFFYQLFQLHAGVVVATSLFSVVQFFFFKGIGRVLPGVWPSTTEPTRFGSTFWDINHYAPYVGSVIPYFLIRLIAAKTNKERVLFGFCFGLTNISLLMTLSRSGWLGYAFGLGVFGLLLIIRKMWRGFSWYLAAMILIMLAALAGDMYFNHPISRRIKSLGTNVYNESFNAHQILNKGHFELFSRHPVIGSGYGNFSDQFRTTPHAAKYFEIDPVAEVRLPSHSVWLEIMSETGMLGLTTFLVLVAYVFRRLFLAMNTSEEKWRYLGVALFASIAGMLFSSLFYHYNLEYFWLIIFLAVFVARSVLPTEQYQPQDYLVTFLLVGLATAMIFPQLGKNALIDWDESIYAQVAKNIARFRDPITLRWHLEKYWFEKPPLYFWFTAALYLVHEVSEFSARFWSALSGVLGVVLVYFFGRDLAGRAVGLASALTLLSTVHWLFQSRNGTLDVMAATCIVATLWLFYRARTRLRDWWLVGVGLGLTLMVKGAVAAVPLLIMVIFGGYEYFLQQKKNYYPCRQLFVRILVPFSVLVLPWHIAVIWLHGRQFIDSYFFYHVLQRSTTGIEQHGHSFFWYLIVIKVWARHNFVLLLGSLALLFTSWLKKRRRGLKANTPEVFLILYLLVAWLIFSLSASKIQWYIMPLYPAMSLIVGYSLVILFRWLPLKRFIPILLMVLTLSVPFFKDRYQSLWNLEDAWRGVAEVVPHLKYEARKVSSPRLLIIDMSPGPAMFYSPHPTETGNFSTLVKAAESENSFFAVARVGQAEDLIKLYPERKVKIYKQSEDFALLGRW